ncbi:hypothetical protein [Duganella sp. BuS-21]|uniref:antitoxin PaaA2 family protein n=1 Tax=Duganella sp. BuS-21 TaxID=2943848 RepID=UPI0035A6C7A7
MKTQTIAPDVLARLADAGSEFSVSAASAPKGWVIYVHDQVGDRALLDIEGRAAAVFDALLAVELRLQELGVHSFAVDAERGELAYDEWLKAEVQQAIDDPSPMVPHEEAMRRIRAAIKTK